MINGREAEEEEERKRKRKRKRGRGRGRGRGNNNNWFEFYLPTNIQIPFPTELIRMRNNKNQPK